MSITKNTEIADSRITKWRQNLITISLMKKLFFMLGCVCLVSCATIKDTACYQNPNNHVNTATAADLQISPTRISFTYTPGKEVRRGGDKNVINTAIREALRNNGGGDVLVAMEYLTLCKPAWWGVSSIRQITVTGYPATYTRFHSLGDEVWTASKCCHK